MPPSWLTGKTNELDITKQSESRPANGGRLAKNLWSQLTLTRRAAALARYTRSAQRRVSNSLDELLSHPPC